MSEKLFCQGCGHEVEYYLLDGVKILTHFGFVQLCQRSECTCKDAKIGKLISDAAEA